MIPYIIPNESEEWRMYLFELLDRHRRKYKFVPLLEALRR
jgi:hypothetical protein